MSGNVQEQLEFYNQRWHEFKYANLYKLTRCASILDAVSKTGLHEPRILDFGCGAGWLTAILGMFGPTVGVDLSDTAIQFAQSRYAHVQYFQADIFNWDYPSEAFDIVVSQEVIEHLGDQRGYIQISAQLLRSNGYLILTTPNKRTMMAMSDEQRANWSKQPIENWLTLNELQSLIALEFDILSIRTVIPGVGYKGVYRLFNSTRVENFIEKIGVGRLYENLRLAIGLGLHTVIVARKRA